ncbi:MAG: DPP IV N-terminal domain-containing protein [Planctomycetaceae bacterium]
MRLMTTLSAVALLTQFTFADEPSVDEIENAHLANIRQVTTSGLPQAGEGYFSPDGTQIVFQAHPIGYPFYQIYTQPLDDGEPRLVSTGRGATTCSYFSIDGKQILFASSHANPHVDVAEVKARELAAQGGRRRYQWDFDEYMDIYVCNFDGTGLTQITDAPGYDAEGSYSSDGKQIVFTSARTGDLELWVMNADGGEPRQLTDAKGYDGGPFFSPDNKWIIFRSDREKEHMLQLYAVSADGKTEVQLTNNLDQVNWAPYFHPSSKYIIWGGADYSKGPSGANFDLFTMEIDYDDDAFTGGEITRITANKGADILPVFSPDGKKLMWTSTRSENGKSQLFLADWLRE